MNKYRRKSIIVEAARFSDKNKDRVYVWAKSIQQNVQHGWDTKGKPILKIPTLEGEIECSLGDYLVVEQIDPPRIYPCKPNIFKKTYEEIKNKKEKMMVKKHENKGVEFLREKER